MRNSGWYIPFWRKPKRAPADQPVPERTEKRRRPRIRSDEELERVREAWVSRYTRQLHAFRTLGLSVGAPRDEIQARYRHLLADLHDGPDADQQRQAMQEAFEALTAEQ